jgi:cytochrome c2
MGCTACHSVDGTTAGKVGPSWKGLFGAQREFKAGEPVVADEAYLHESILDPTAKVVQGFEKNDAGMPSYAGVLTEQQIQALILYIKTLK